VFPTRRVGGPGTSHRTRARRPRHRSPKARLLVVPYSAASRGAGMGPGTGRRSAGSGRNRPHRSQTCTGERVAKLLPTRRVARSEPTTTACTTFQRISIWLPMPNPRESSARALERKRFEAAMRSEPVQKLIRENASPDRISGLVGASHDRVRSWLKARGREAPLRYRGAASTPEAAPARTS